MCISVPAKIISIIGNVAAVEQQGNTRRVVLTVDNAQPGDWVLIYGEVALRLLNQIEAEEANMFLSTMKLGCTV